MRAWQYKLIVFESGEKFFNLEMDPFEQDIAEDDD
jgi:hypothetical protein